MSQRRSRNTTCTLPTSVGDQIEQSNKTQKTKHDSRRLLSWKFELKDKETRLWKSNVSTRFIAIRSILRASEVRAVGILDLPLCASFELQKPLRWWTSHELFFILQIDRYLSQNSAPKTEHCYERRFVGCFLLCFILAPVRTRLSQMRNPIRLPLASRVPLMGRCFI